MKNLQAQKRSMEESGDLLSRFKRGRPAIVDSQPGLLHAIAEIAQYRASPEERRCFDCIRSVSTLDDLTENLKTLGFTISRTATYYHLMPRHPSTIDGKRHVTSATVRVVRAPNDIHKSHVDAMFARTSINHLN